jgi:hypothetical protein
MGRSRFLRNMVTFYQTIRRHIQGDSNLYSHRPEYIKAHIWEENYMWLIGKYGRGTDRDLFY